MDILKTFGDVVDDGLGCNLYTFKNAVVNH